MRLSPRLHRSFIETRPKSASRTNVPVHHQSHREAPTDSIQLSHRFPPAVQSRTRSTNQQLAITSALSLSAAARAVSRSHARRRFPPVASAFGGASEPVAHPERRAHIACVASTPSWVQNPRPFAHRRLDQRARARLRRTAPRWKIHPTRTNPVRPNHRAVSRERPRSRARDARDEPLNVGRDASAGA